MKKSYSFKSLKTGNIYGPYLLTENIADAPGLDINDKYKEACKTLAIAVLRDKKRMIFFDEVTIHETDDTITISNGRWEVLEYDGHGLIKTSLMLASNVIRRMIKIVGIGIHVPEESIIDCFGKDVSLDDNEIWILGNKHRV